MAIREARELERENANLRAVVEAQRVRLDEQGARIRSLESEVEELKALVAALTGKSLSKPSSQKAPFEKSQEDRGQAANSSERKKKGRPPGAKGSTRERLTEEDVEETRTVEERGCPHRDCSGKLANVTFQSRIVETVIPAKRRVVEYRWCHGECPVHGTVTLRPGDAPPKAHLSNEVILIAAELVVGSGMSLEKTCRHLKKRFGIELTTGGLAQALQRLGLAMVNETNAIEKELQRSEAVFADETGGRVDGDSWWIWAFVTKTLASFRVEWSRGSEVIFRVLGEDFLGILISDFFSAYNVPNCRKQKCLAHLLRTIEEILEDYEGHPGRPPPALEAMKQWAKDALKLKDRKNDLAESTFKRRRSALEQRLDAIIASSSGNCDVERLLNRLDKHREALLLFLYHDGVEGTNNRAERAIRKAVLQRKVNGGHRSWAGAQTYAILLSVLVSCDLQNRDFVKTGLEVLQRHYRGLDAGTLV